MSHFSAPPLSRTLPALAVTLLTLSSPALTAEEADAPRGPAVTVLKAAKSCFANIVEVAGIILPREETAVRPERLGLKIADVLAEAGDSVNAGQTLARLNLPEGGSINVQAPVAGTISVSNATIGAMASAKGEALFNIIARNEYDLVGLVPIGDLAKLTVNQPAAVHIIGVSADIEAKIRRIAPTVEPAVQLGQVFIGITSNRRVLVNSAARALIKTRPELQRRSPPHRRAIWQRRHRGAGREAAADRDQARGDRADERRPDRNPRRAHRRRGSRCAGRRAAARGRPGAAGDGGGEYGREVTAHFLLPLWEKVARSAG